MWAEKSLLIELMNNMFNLINQQMVKYIIGNAYDKILYLVVEQNIYNKKLFADVPEKNIYKNSRPRYGTRP